MKKERRTYNAKGIEINGLNFKNSKERKYVQEAVYNIAEKLKSLRIEKGLSQEQLAELTGISISTIKFIEQKQRSPSLGMLFKILFALDRNVKILDTSD